MTDKPVNFLDEISNFIFTNKYARYNSVVGRRETWGECVDRVMTMHIAKFRKKLSKEDLAEVKWAFDEVNDKSVVPSMRSMQFAGKAITAANSRVFNCAVRHVDSIRSFAEIFYLLLCGCGVGIGVSRHFINRLPCLVGAKDKTGTVLTYVVDDSIEGWSDSIEALLNCYFHNTAYTGRKIVFDYSKIRPAGAILKTSGGKAPGYKGLKNCHRKIKALLDHVIEDLDQTRIKSVNAYDILMHVADAVLSGGIRRSATSVIFEKDDEDMMNAKTYFTVSKYTKFSLDEETQIYHGKVTVNKKVYEIEIPAAGFDWEYKQLVDKNQISWHHIEPQRARSNNSVLLLRDQTTELEFESIIERTKQFGEPGFVFANHPWQLFNPCFTIDTKVLTDQGWRTFGELLGTTPTIVQDNRVRGLVLPLTGEEAWDVSLGSVGTTTNVSPLVSKTGENQAVYELELSCGRTVKATANHHFATRRGMVELADLQVGEDKVLLALPNTPVIDQDYKFKLGFLAGLIEGDGGLTDETAMIDVWHEEHTRFEPTLELIEEMVKDHLTPQSLVSTTKMATDAPKFKLQTQVGTCVKHRLSSPPLARVLAQYGFTEKHTDLSWLHKNSKEFKAGFISGMLSSDGHVDYNDNSRSVSLRITQSNKEGLKTLQLVLQELGIMARVYPLLPEGPRMLPDTDRVLKEYNCKASYRLVIPGVVNCQHAEEMFQLLFGKKERLLEVLADKKSCNTKNESTVVKITPVGSEDVYCLKEDNRRTLIANGMTARRCFEIGFIPVTADGVCGVQFCNLSSINGAQVKSVADLMRATKSATIIGTLQASYTEQLSYLSPAAKQLTEDEALLGVSITGVMDNPDIILSPDNQKAAAEYALEVNREWAAKISIKPAARVTCIKPEGTSSLVLRSASGIHPHHARRYFRRVQCNKLDPVYKFFKERNPHMCEPGVWSANKTDDVITFPLTVSDTAMVKADLSALAHLNMIKSTQQNWVLTGTSPEANTKPVSHNVSCTTIVKDDEWSSVIKYLYDNRAYFSAVSLLPFIGDKLYKQAPLEAVTTDEDEAKWDALITSYVPVDYKELKEDEDSTRVQETASCAGGKCELF